jgi:hypothetical protein
MGAPIGNQNAAKAKLFEGALRRVLAADDYAKLNKVAQNLVDAAENGEQWAVTYLIDRMDGKPSQSTAITGEGGGPVDMSLKVEFVRTVPREA